MSAPSVEAAWFQPMATRDHAERALAGKPPGAFIIRGSSKAAGSFINHVLIRKFGDAEYGLDTADGKSTRLLDQKVVTPVPTFFEQMWYWGDVSREESEQRVAAAGIGSFLGRYYSRGFAITFCSEPRRVEHLYIFESHSVAFNRAPTRLLGLSSERFSSLPDPSRWRSVYSGSRDRNSGSDTWEGQFEKHQARFTMPLERPPGLNTTPLKMLWACSMGYIELAIQFITREGTSRTTRTRGGWTPLLEALRALSEIASPYLKDAPRGEVTKLIEFAKMMIDDKRIDLNATVVDEALVASRPSDWDDFGNGHTALSLCLQGPERFNPELVETLLRNPAVIIDGIALLSIVKHRMFSLYNELLPRVSPSVMAQWKEKLLFAVLDSFTLDTSDRPLLRIDGKIPPTSPASLPLVMDLVNKYSAQVNVCLNYYIDPIGLQLIPSIVLAARGGDLQVVKFILSKGADLRMKSTDASRSAAEVALELIRNPKSGALIDVRYEPIAALLKNAL